MMVWMCDVAIAPARKADRMVGERGLGHVGPWFPAMALVLVLSGGIACGAGAGAEVVRCELAVIGGGSGGFGAAAAAAQMGVDVVLVEQADCLGGTRSGRVSCWEMGAGGMGDPL